MHPPRGRWCPSDTQCPIPLMPPCPDGASGVRWESYEEAAVPEEITLDLDARRRVSLGSLFDDDVTHLVARRHEDGSVVLEPATVVTKLEQRFHSDPDATAAARRAANSTTATKLDVAARRAGRKRVG